MSRKKKKSSQPSWWVAVGLLILGLFSFLGKMQLPEVDPSSPGANQTSPSEPGLPGSPAPFPPSSAPDTIRIASFNIQVFGQSKMGKTEVINNLARIIQQFDLVAIQEIRSMDQNLIPDFLKIVNSRGPQYQYVISPRLGRTSSKEQYAYLYRTDRIAVIERSVFNVDDPRDLLHREPFVASFQTKVNNGTPFSFTLINAHTDPDEAEWEVEQLAQVYQFVSQFHRHEDDIILLGDLNVDHQKLSHFTRIPQIQSIVPVGPTNTRGTRQYDHILVNLLATTEFTGRAGVLNMMEMFQISLDEALELSDHHPVWAEFSVYERREPTRLAIQEENPFLR